jgi:hypothetical protein
VKPLKTLKAKGPKFGAEFGFYAISPDGKWVIGEDVNKEGVTLARADGEVKRHWPSEYDATQERVTLPFSADGQRLYSSKSYTVDLVGRYIGAPFLTKGLVGLKH